ncbi:MAG: DUF1566 domain-containing protein [Gammaproteobacteria bacterium]|nr:DUF1566 domain-containing protein [Gammaproteobacteria bacterium]
MKHSYYKFISLFLALSLFVAPASAQICALDTTPQSISPTNFSINQGVITDIASSLTWQRCFYGQTWNESLQRCQGNPIKLDWKQALNAAASLNGNWRLPNVKEILTIVDYQCMSPPLNPELFPEAPSSLRSGLWTSTPLQTNISITSPVQSAWLIELGHGSLQHHTMDDPNYLLLVRDGF